MIETQVSKFGCFLIRTWWHLSTGFFYYRGISDNTQDLTTGETAVLKSSDENAHTPQWIRVQEGFDTPRHVQRQELDGADDRR
jgi:hypothetical protein